MTTVIPPSLEDSSPAKALERLAGAHPLPCGFSAAGAFVIHSTQAQG